MLTVGELARVGGPHVGGGGGELARVGGPHVGRGASCHL